MTQHNAPTKVVVIGGGYSGMLAANQLRMRGDVDITLINPRPQVRRADPAAPVRRGNPRRHRSYGSVLGDGIRLVVDSATRIDTANRPVELASGAALDYDYLIYAVGSTGAVPASVPGAAEFAYPMAELEQAQRLRPAWTTCIRYAPVMVVGAGLTGIETAAEFAEQGRNVTLVCGDQLGPSWPSLAVGRWPRCCANWASRCSRTDVVTEVRPDAVVFADGAVRPSAVTIWTAGFGVPGLAAASGLPTDAMGRLLTDETLTSVDDPRIIAAGDCRVTVGAAAADELPGRDAAGRPGRGHRPEPHRRHRARAHGPGVLRAVHQPGPQAGTVQFARTDDTAVNVYLGGRAAASIKEAVCRVTLSTLRREAGKPGSAFWFKGGPRAGAVGIRPAGGPRR